MKKIYYGKAVYDYKEINAVTKVLREQPLQLIDGKNVKKLQNNICKLFGKKYGLMVNSGSSANLLAISSSCSEEISKDTSAITNIFIFTKLVDK